MFVGWQLVPSRVASLSAVTQHEDLTRLGKDQPHDADAVAQVPLCLDSEDVLVLVLARDFDGQQRRRVAQPADGRPDLSTPPNGSVGGAHVAAELHPSFVPSDDEIGVGFGPGPEDVHDIHRDVLLNVSARRHVQESPVHPFEPPLHVWPCRELFRAKVWWPQLQRKTNARAPQHDLVVIEKFYCWLGHVRRSYISRRRGTTRPSSPRAAPGASVRVQRS